MVKLKTRHFGEIEADETRFIHFTEGIPAFEEEQEFMLIPFVTDSESDDNPYVIMQSTKTPGLAFVVANPYRFFSDYEFSLEDDVLKGLGLDDPENLSVYVILAIPNGVVRDMTANLIAPIVIAENTLKAQQVILTNTQYSTKHRIFPAKVEG